MRKRTFVLILLLASVQNFLHAEGYIPDILVGYEQKTIQMTSDYEGDVFCTLVRKPLMDRVDHAVLYIHGYNDYFFQSALGDSIQRYGFNFYALDLRKYGRSLREHQRACFCLSLNEYFADIDSALATLKREGNSHILLMAHSTGGLITPLYLQERKELAEVEGLILNSPFFDMNMSWFMEKIAIPAVSFAGKFFPYWVIEKEGLPSYAESLLATGHGEWSFDTNWKRPEGFPKTAGWLRAIHQGHKQIKKGLSLDCPVLVLSSDKSFRETREWQEEYRTADIVLDINDIQRLAPNLGPYVTRDTIPNGKHDLLLSDAPYRQISYEKFQKWMQAIR